MAKDWFSNGVDAMSKSFGAQEFRSSNPMMGRPAMRSGAGSFGGMSPFTQAAISQQRGAFGQTNGPWGANSRVRDYGNPTHTFANRAYENAMKLQQKWQPTPGMSQPGQTGASVGKAAATGGKYSSMDDTANEINAASAKFGVPANLIKATIFRESSGDWGRDGNRYVYLAERGTNINPYSGITDPAAREWGYDPKALTGNRALQIEAVAKGLSTLYNRVGQQYGWDGVIATYYSGKPDQSYTPSDSVQYGKTHEYVSQVKGMWNELDAMSGSTGYDKNAGPSGGSVGGSYNIWGGGDYPITQEHGPTAFSAANPSWYTYAAGLGINGHPGVDVGMPSGTKLYTPAAGTVIIAGGSGYYRDVRGDGPGQGEFRLQLDNGDIVILGHMASIHLAAGQRVPAGAFVGTSGSFNGDHLHYEVRKKTPGATSTGYTAVDPRQYFSGGGSVQQPAQQTPMPQMGGGLWWQRTAGNLFRS